MMAVEWQRMGLAAGALALAAVLAACSSPITDMPSLSSANNNTQAKPADAYTYMPVHDLPPDRAEATIPPAQRVKIESDLIAAREQQAADAKGEPPAVDKAKTASKSAQTKSAQTKSAQAKSAQTKSAQTKSASKSAQVNPAPVEPAQVTSAKNQPAPCGAPGASC